MPAETDARELTERIAREVMGWTLENNNGVPGARDGERQFWILEQSQWDNTFIPLTNPADDYRVLQRVRETWGNEAFRRFLDAIGQQHRPRVIPFCVSRGWTVYGNSNRSDALYQPGDYSRAALASLSTLSPE